MPFLSSTVMTVVSRFSAFLDLFEISIVRTANWRPGKLPGPLAVSLANETSSTRSETPSPYLTVPSVEAGLAVVVGVPV